MSQYFPDNASEMGSFAQTQYHIVRVTLGTERNKRHQCQFKASGLIPIGVPELIHSFNRLRNCLSSDMRRGGNSISHSNRHGMGTWAPDRNQTNSQISIAISNSSQLGPNMQSTLTQFNDSKFSDQYYTLGTNRPGAAGGGLRDSIASSNHGGLPVMNQTMQHARKRTDDFTGERGAALFNSGKKEEAQPVVKMLKPPLNSMAGGTGVQLRMSRKPGDNNNSIYPSRPSKEPKVEQVSHEELAFRRLLDSTPLAKAYDRRLNDTQSALKSLTFTLYDSDYTKHQALATLYTTPDDSYAILFEAVDQLTHYRQLKQSSEESKRQEELHFRTNYKTQRIPFSQENYDILLQEMQGMASELEKAKNRSGQLTTINFELDQLNKKLTIQNEQLKGVNLKLKLDT